MILSKEYDYGLPCVICSRRKKGQPHKRDLIIKTNDAEIKVCYKCNKEWKTHKRIRDRMIEFEEYVYNLIEEATRLHYLNFV